MSEVNKENYMKDRKGRLVPVDRCLTMTLRWTLSLKNRLSPRRLNAMNSVTSSVVPLTSAMLDLVAEKYGRTRGGAKGNVTFSSFDGAQQITIRVQETLTFGPELQIAKDLIDECVTEWSEGANANLRAIISDAFQVDKEGQLNTGRILSLRRVKIQDERWNRAMEAISESLQVAMSKTYINFREKDKHGKLINIPLDIAAI